MGPLPVFSDKWSSAQSEWNRRYPLLTHNQHHCSLGHDHAGAGGESVDDGKMNTRDFDLTKATKPVSGKCRGEVRK